VRRNASAAPLDGRGEQDIGNPVIIGICNETEDLVGQRNDRSGETFLPSAKNFLSIGDVFA
jgi:hypothetical protein